MFVCKVAPGATSSQVQQQTAIPQQAQLENLVLQVSHMMGNTGYSEVRFLFFLIFCGFFSSKKYFCPKKTFLVFNSLFVFLMLWVAENIVKVNRDLFFQALFRDFEHFRANKNNRYINFFVYF